MKKQSFITACFLILSTFSLYAQPQCWSAQGSTSLWPKVSDEAKPYARWWWLGSAVDQKNLDYLLDEYAKAGLGGLEITPIYGVQGNDRNDIEFLSPRWMEMLKFLQQKGKTVGIKIDMNTGTGWPFGGPSVTEGDAAKRFELDEQGNITTALTKQKVKRAAPGGEGFVMDHFDKGAVERYLDRFTKAFKENGVTYPHNFFNDSYEVYGANWTPTLISEFQKRKGYDITQYKQLLQERLGKKDSKASKDLKDSKASIALKDPKASIALKDPKTAARIISDYREVLGELLLENFTQTWTAWAHEHGTVTRNQAHGSPGNLIDIYAAVDIPECEGFGLSNFGIKGLRQDSLTRPNFSDLSMLKYASSAAHISGKNLTSSETFTWLTEHFRTSLSQCKPELDLFFVAGVNHVYFHGTCYSPKEAAWPGWKFYASVDMSPTNTIWNDAPAMFNYITRCQSFLQMGQPDNELLVYLPIYDMWNNNGGLLLFDIHKMDRLAPDFIKTIHNLNDAGYDCDYISDKFLSQLSLTANGQLQTESGVTYKAIIIPNAKLMPVETAEKLLSLAQQGAKIVFLGGYPTDVPGYNNLKARRTAFKKILKQLPKYGLSDIASTGVIAEEMKSMYGLHAIRRTNSCGHHYFISSLQDKGVNAWVNLSVQAASALLYNPMTGDVQQALLRQKDGRTQVYLKLESGESCILRTFSEKKQFDRVPQFRSYEPAELSEISLSKGKCSLDINGSTIQLDKLKPWTALGNAALDSLAGSGTYHINIYIGDELTKAQEWQLDLGDVRESAKVWVNDSYVGTLWAVPFRINIGDYLVTGDNKIDIEVTNLPANRIAAMDKRGNKWRIFKEINVVDRNYKKTGYGHWPVSESGLNSEPRLIPLTVGSINHHHKQN